MKNTFKLTSLFVLLILFACSTDNEIESPEIEIIEEEETTEESGGIVSNFNDLKVGDTFQFSLFLGENYFDVDNNNFDYTGDYLNVEIIDVTANGFKVKEWIDASSNMFVSSENYYYQDKDAVLTNNWILENDKIVIETSPDDFLTSHLFLDGTRSLELSLDKFDGEEIEIESWKTDKGFSEIDSKFYVNDFELFGVTYPHLNVVVNDSPMSYDGNGNTYLYSNGSGFVRSVTYSAWTGSGIGWDRVK